MKLISRPLNQEEIKNLHQKYGNYLKLTVDIENNLLVAGCKLHSDGEEILLREGGKNINIWGGGINFQTRIIDTIAILNLRPQIENNSLEILDRNKRERFLAIVKNIFSQLWT